MVYVHGLNSFVSLILKLLVLCLLFFVECLVCERVWYVSLYECRFYIYFNFLLLLVSWEYDAMCFNVLTFLRVPSRCTSSFSPTIRLCMGSCVSVCVSLYCPYITECVVNPPGEALLKKTDFSSLSSSHLH